MDHFKEKVNSCDAEIELAEMHTVSDVYREATRIVKAMLVRYARSQKLFDVHENTSVHQTFDSWLAGVLADGELRSHAPMVSLMEDEGLTPCELYILIILYTHHTHPYIRDVVMSLRSHLKLNAFTPSILIELLQQESPLESFDALGLYDFIHQSPLVVLRDNENSAAGEPDVGLHPRVLRMLNPRADMSAVESPYYRILRPDRDRYFADAQAEEWASVCRSAQKQPGGIRLLLSGRAGNGKRAFVRYIARHLSLPVIELNTAELVSAGLHSYRRLFNEMASFGGIVLIPHVHLIAGVPHGEKLLAEALETLTGITFLTTEKVHQLDSAFVGQMHHLLDCPGPSQSVRRRIWQVYLGAGHEDVIGKLASAFVFNPLQIRHSVELAGVLKTQHVGLSTERILEMACHKVMHQSFDSLAVRTGVEHASLERFILPPKDMSVYLEILSAARNYDRIMVDWGFEEVLTTGRGLCILFDGPPGTGKTYAAEVMAHELNRPLQRVDMSNLVSKWVGETGENIARLFAAARSSHAIILLDEADALLSKRSTQSGKSTERYANMEINILLQELERFHGISILTTNLEHALDDALRRRIQFRISFSEPGVQERAALWRGMLPGRAPVSPSIDYYRLAKHYEMSGGHIKNACLNAAYRACHENSEITESHLLHAADAEYSKMGKLVHHATDDGDEWEV